MTVIVTVIVFVFVVGVLAVVGFALFESSPFPRRENPYRDATGKRRFPSPHLEDTPHDIEENEA